MWRGHSCLLRCHSWRRLRHQRRDEPRRVRHKRPRPTAAFPLLAMKYVTLRNYMRTVDLIHRKRDGEELSPEEIGFLVDGYTAGNIPDYQMSAFLMATFYSGMSDREV